MKTRMLILDVTDDHSTFSCLLLSLVVVLGIESNGTALKCPMVVAATVHTESQYPAY